MIRMIRSRPDRILHPGGKRFRPPPVHDGKTYIDLYLGSHFGPVLVRQGNKWTMPVDLDIIHSALMIPIPFLQPFAKNRVHRRLLFYQAAFFLPGTMALSVAGCFLSVYRAVYLTKGVAGWLAGIRQAPPTLASSFSAVWTPTIASQLTFCRIFHGLQD